MGPPYTQARLGLNVKGRIDAILTRSTRSFRSRDKVGTPLELGHFIHNASIMLETTLTCDRLEP